MAMRILHIIPSFHPADSYGGPIESVYQLCCHLAQNACEIQVLTTNANGLNEVLDLPEDREIEVAERVRVRYCKRLMRHSASLTLVRLLYSYVRWADVVHVTAVYSFPTIPSLLLCKALGKPTVWSPRGALQRWEGSTRVGAKTLWEWVCGVVAPRRLILHVTSQEEATESLKRFPGVETVIIPNGVEIPETISHIDEDGILRLLYLGRLDVKKGIENLLEACKILTRDSRMQLSLTIAGAGDPEYTRSIRTKIEGLGLSERVRMVGKVVGEAKQRLFESADIAVVPSYTENFGIVVGESLGYGVPVLASKGTPWRRLEEMECGLWVDNHPESLAKAIERMSKMSLREMGERGRKWMAEEFCWRVRAQEMARLYEMLARDN